MAGCLSRRTETRFQHIPVQPPPKATHADARLVPYWYVALYVEMASTIETRVETQRNGAALTAASRSLPWLLSAAFLGVFVYYIAASLHWIVMWDGAVMHYIHFLITRGFHPYSDITDMNLPGCYLTEGWAMDLFGWGDRGWRIYEYALLLVLTAGGMVIGGARHWLAGVYSGLFFVLLHGSEGPMMAVERDEVMTVLLVAATACLFLGLRRRQPLWLLPFGLLAGLAVSLKPGALLLDLAFTLLAGITIRQHGLPARRYLLWAAAGNGVVLALMIGFVVRHDAFSGLLFIVQHVLPAYVQEKNFGRFYLLRHLTPVPAIPLVLAALASALLRRRPLTWERSALLLGIFVGALSYWLQGKGYLYHRYLFSAFLLLWVGWELTPPAASQPAASQTPLRWLQIAGVALLLLVATPFYVHRIYAYPRTIPPPQNLALALERDLTQLGGGTLQNQVQCLDLVNGCLNALYRLRLVGNTGTTGDLLLFSPNPSPAVTYYRAWFSRRQQQHPADIVVLGNEWYFQPTVTFNKIDTWPQYATSLRNGYVPVVERTFGTFDAPAYRIYLRKGSDVLAREQANPLH